MEGHLGKSAKDQLDVNLSCTSEPDGMLTEVLQIPKRSLCFIYQLIQVTQEKLLTMRVRPVAMLAWMFRSA